MSVTTRIRPRELTTEEMQSIISFYSIVKSFFGGVVGTYWIQNYCDYNVAAQMPREPAARRSYWLAQLERCQESAVQVFENLAGEKPLSGKDWKRLLKDFWSHSQDKDRALVPGIKKRLANIDRCLQSCLELLGEPRFIRLSVIDDLRPKRETGIKEPQGIPGGDLNKVYLAMISTAISPRGKAISRPAGPMGWYYNYDRREGGRTVHCTELRIPIDIRRYWEARWPATGTDLPDLRDFDYSGARGVEYLREDVNGALEVMQTLEREFPELAAPNKASEHENHRTGEGIVH